MSLVEELGVSLKDFLPQTSAHLMSYDGLPVAVVSTRLYQRLKEYAEAHHMPLKLLLQRLRDEIHAA
jgi:hypothetical protein